MDLKVDRIIFTQPQGENLKKTRLSKFTNWSQCAHFPLGQILYSLHNDEGGDMTSTTTGLDMESILDGHTENTSEDDDDLSTTIDTTDAHAIRRQLESLESMYTEVRITLFIN